MLDLFKQDTASLRFCVFRSCRLSKAGRYKKSGCLNHNIAIELSVVSERQRQLQHAEGRKRPRPIQGDKAMRKTTWNFFVKTKLLVGSRSFYYPKPVS